MLDLMTLCSPFSSPTPPSTRSTHATPSEPSTKRSWSRPSCVRGNEEKNLEMKLSQEPPSSFLQCSLPSVGSLAVLTTQLNERRAPLFRPNTGPSAGARQGENVFPPTLTSHTHSTNPNIFQPGKLFQASEKGHGGVYPKKVLSFVLCYVDQRSSTRGVSGPTLFFPIMKSLPKYFSQHINLFLKKKKKKNSSLLAIFSLTRLHTN